MKKKLLFITMFFGLILIPKGVLAASIGLSCPSSVTVGENITCTLTAHHETISGVKGSISFSGMSYHSVSNLTGSNYFSVSSSRFDGAIDITSGSKSLAKYVFTTSSAGTATINVSCSELVDGTNFDTHSCTGASKTITIKAKSQPSTPQPSTPKPNNSQTSKPSNNKPQNNLSTNNNVKDINVEGYELVKVDNNNYTLTVSNNVTSVNVNASAEDSKATVTGTGARELQVGENNVEVIVTSESGTENKINIKITRKDGFYLNDLKEALNIGDEVSIVISAEDKISKENLQSIKDSKKKVSFNYYDADKKLIYSFSIDGSKINNVEEVNSNLTFNSDNIDKIQILSNYADGIYLDFEHKNSFPNDTKVKVFVGNKFENQSIVNIYQYDNEKLISTAKDVEVKDGYIEFEIKQGAEYLVTRANIVNVEDNDLNIFLIVSIVELLIIVGLVVVDYLNINPLSKLKKEKN